MAIRSPLFALALIFGSTAYSTPLAEAKAPKNACLEQRPLISVDLDDVSAFPSLGAFLGSWNLPVSGDQADLMTAAKLHVTVEPETSETDPSKKWALKLAFTFDDPEGWGLPFNFSYFQVTWDDSRGKHSAVFDWSVGCEEVGVTLFPLSTFSDQTRLDLLDSEVLKNVRVRLWGNR